MSNINFTPKHISRGSLPNHLDKIKTEARERRRNILYLILSYLKENMLEQTAETLTREAQLDNNYQLCENVELDVILQEYQSYYYTKFQKYPKIIRKLDETEIRASASRSSKRGKSAKRTTKTPAPPKELTESTSDNEEFQFEIISLNSGPTKHIDHPKPKSRPFLPELEQYTSEDKDLVSQVSNQIVTHQEIDVKWTDCLGLDNAIEILKESTVYPLHYPEIFKDMSPWNGVLLHGPPGTGKTLLAKALASETRTTFFNVTTSTFISKWRGESEKLIKHLFDMAKFHAPSTIFFDEIDALVSSAKDSHEASKRFRSELLVQLDGISSGHGQIFVLASTNSPWDLDGAILRRFDKRVLVDMPTKEARGQILKHLLRNTSCNRLSEEEMEEFGRLTEHFSGSDIKNLSKEVVMAIVRDKIRVAKEGKRNFYNRVVSFNDIRQALLKIRPSTSSVMCKKYYQWQNEHGAL